MTTAAAVPQNSRRSAAFTIFLFRLALDAEPRVRQRVQTIEADLLAALLALAEALGRLVQPAQRFVHVPQVAAFLRREQECFLPLHRVGALVGHMEGIAREISVGGLQARVERLAVMAQLLDHAGPLLEQPLLEMAQLFLVEAALAFTFVDFVGITGLLPFVRRDAATRSWCGAPRCLRRAANRARRAPRPASGDARASPLRRSPETRELRRPHPRRR